MIPPDKDVDMRNQASPTSTGRNTFIQLQYDHLSNNSNDLYANAKYANGRGFQDRSPERIVPLVAP